MTEHFNKLTPAEDERLAKLAEELCKAGQVIAKIMRHGYESYNPDARSLGDYRGQLTFELGDVVRAIAALTRAGDIDQASLDSLIAKGPHRRYMHHQE